MRRRERTPYWSPTANVPDLAAALALGLVRSVDLVHAGLRRIEEVDGELRAVVTVAPDAIEQARRSDLRREAGAPLSPLDGVPFTVKDCIETAGLRTTHGSRIFEDWIPSEDAPVVRALKEAGMVLLAKTSLDDFAASCYGECSVRGSIHNPHNLSLMVGGSSGGSAVSVASGYAPISIGTDTGGSLRIPAALVGVATLRPTQGLLSTEGIFPRSFSQDTPGPMAIDVAGLACIMSVLTAGGCPPPANSFERGDLKARLGVISGGLALLGDDPGGPITERFHRSISQLRAAGFELVPVRPPSSDLLHQSALVTLESSLAVDDYLARVPDPPVRTLLELCTRPELPPRCADSLRRELAAARDAPKARKRALALRRELERWTDRLFQRYDLDAVAYPSVQFTAAPIGVEQRGVFTRWSEHTGRPALGLPLPCSIGEMPGSMETLGRTGCDGELLRLGLLIEGAISGTASHVSPDIGHALLPITPGS